LQIVVVWILRHASIKERPRQVVDGVLFVLDGSSDNLGVEMIVQTVIKMRLFTTAMMTNMHSAAAETMKTDVNSFVTGSESHVYSFYLDTVSHARYQCKTFLERCSNFGQKSFVTSNDPDSRNLSHLIMNCSKLQFWTNSKLCFVKWKMWYSDARILTR